LSVGSEEAALPEIDSSNSGENASSNTYERGHISPLGSRNPVFPAFGPLAMARAIRCIL
jgi:hypothetical protein